MKTKKSIKIACSDDIVLSADLYKPETLKGAVMIAPATGVKRIFYHSFATYLSENGYGVICFDNRGVGDSVQGSINSGNPSLISWGSLDMPAVLRKLQELFPSTSYHIIGHSAGGQLIGLMDNSKDISSFLAVASSSGSVRNINFPFKVKAYILLNLFIPFSNFMFGKTNSQWVGMGESLPKDVGKQWRKWCNGTGYVATDFGKTIKNHFYDDINIPSLWIHASDDPIANHTNVKDMIRVYSNTSATIITLNPEDFACKEIGHMKFFSSKLSNLWPYALNWLESNS